jgi:hypothetical protein
LGCAGGGALVAVVIAGQAVDIQPAADRVGDVVLRYGKDLFFCLLVFLVNG